ncbi:MAG: hypothetical protein ABSH48_20985, partial [Verrucomicrobiota bacterium]
MNKFHHLPLLAWLLMVLFFAGFSQRLWSGPPSSELGISLSGGQVSLDWQGSDDWLQAAGGLAPYLWINVSPTNPSATNHASFAADQTAQFFRLVNSSGLPPATRLGLTVEEDGTFVLSWDPVPGAVTYNVYLATVSGINQFNYMVLPGGTQITGISDTFTNLTNLVSGTTYYFAVTCVSSLAQESAASNEASGVYGWHAGISGSVFTTLTFGTNSTAVAVPGVQILLSNTIPASAVVTTVSDDNGLFDFGSQPAGNYQICWQAAGFAADCQAGIVTLSNVPTVLDPIELFPLTNGVGMVYGQITYPDGTPAVEEDAFFQITNEPTVQLTDGSGNLLVQVTPDVNGEYIMTGLPVTNNLTLTATAGYGSVTANIDTSVTGEADLVLPNSSPQITAAFAVSTNDGRQIVRAFPGTTVQLVVVASDPAGYPLHYLWLPGGANASTFVSTDSSNVLWTLPPGEAQDEMYIRVYNGNGGYATAKISIRAANDIYFSGYVTAYDWTAPTNEIFVTNATVTVNGDATTTTDTNGYFSLTTTNEAAQYVVTVYALGYVPQPLVRIFPDEASDQAYQLVLGTNVCVPVTPGGPVNVTADGLEVIINNANFVYGNGSPYPGSSVCFLLAAFDPCLTVLPVGESGLDTNGNPVMPEFVAGGVVLAFDGAGVPLTLAGGNLATVIVPAGAGCYTNCSDLPGGVVAWTNSLQDGLWRLAGTASPTVNYLGQCAYVESAPVGPFFAAAPNNAPGPFQVTINTDNSINLPALLLVRDSFKKVVASKVLFRGKAADSSLTLNVRKNDTVSPRIAGLREAPGVFYRDVNAFSGSINDAQAVDNNANSPKDEMLFDDIINVMANQTVTLTLNSLKARKANAFNDPGHFLAYLFKTGDPTTALQYYAAIGAITNPAKISGPKDTFGKWLATNGFLNVNNNLVPTASAVYFNAGDLGFGREMNLKTNGDEFAFYVTNYKDADVAASKKGPVATVCMEFSRAADPASAKKVGSPYIKFYVYEHSTNVDLFSSPLVVSADLDGFGQKFVPNLCMVCHGGSRGQLSQIKADVAAGKPGVNGDLATRFIPFDLESFTYPNIDPTTLRAPFKVMNQLI